MLELPRVAFSNGFYIYFNTEKKEEYYATPLHFYYADRKDYLDREKTTIYLEKDISKVKPSKTEKVYKNPATLYLPYKEKLGTMLLKLLNADLSSSESAYNTFFYAYGYELIKDYAPSNINVAELSSEVEFTEMIRTTYNRSLALLLELQDSYREAVDYIYNLNGKGEEVKNYKANSKFLSYVITHKGEIHRYSSKIDILKDDYIEKYYKYNSSYSTALLAKEIDENNINVEMSPIYTSTELSNILFIILEELVKIDINPIKICKHCGKYFIPLFRQDEIYCEFLDENGKTCKEKGANEEYKKNLENIPALLEYRRSYQQKIMVATRNKENKKLKRDFDKWKKEAQAKIKLYKQGKLAENDLYNWMMENK